MKLGIKAASSPLSLSLPLSFPPTAADQQQFVSAEFC